MFYIKARNANCYCGCRSHCWFFGVGGELKTRLTIINFVFITRYFSKRPKRIMSLLQHYFTADTKFLTSFLTIAISIVTWCLPYIFFFLFNFGSTLSLLSSFNRELISKGIRCTSIGSKTFIFLNVVKPKFLFLIVLIEPFVRKFGHHTARQNTAQRCKKRTFG